MRRGKERKGKTNNSHCCPEACVVLPQQHTQLSNDNSRWKHSAPVSHSVSHNQPGVDSVLTYIHTTQGHPSAQWWQWVRRLQASCVIGGGDRWFRQHGRQKDIKLPLYQIKWPLVSSLSYLTGFFHWSVDHHSVTSKCCAFSSVGNLAPRLQ